MAKLTATIRIDPKDLKQVQELMDAARKVYWWLEHEMMASRTQDGLRVMETPEKTFLRGRGYLVRLGNLLGENPFEP